MEYFWKQNKIYIIAVAAVLVVVGLWWMFVLGPINKGAQDFKDERGQAQTELEAKMAGGVATEDMIARGQKDLERTQALVKSLLADAAYVPKDPFNPPDATAAQVFYDGNLTTWKNIKASAGRVHLMQTTSPFPAIQQASPSLARELLARLAVMNRVVDLAIKSRVTRIEKVNPLPDFEVDKMQDGSMRQQFLNVLPVKLTVTASSASLFALVHGLSKKGEGYVALLGFSAVPAAEDERADQWKCDLEVAALVVNEKLPLTEKKEQPK